LLLFPRFSQKKTHAAVFFLLNRIPVGAEEKGGAMRFASFVVGRNHSNLSVYSGTLFAYDKESPERRFHSAFRACIHEKGRAIPGFKRLYLFASWQILKKRNQIKQTAPVI
ncbi:hypothetical protein, partial [Aneurinibacillus danicus]|uniref:hypothetical protein n=2 Tax=Aneurinibacillus TaxID=55079 RepID=UPI00147929D5